MRQQYASLLTTHVGKQLDGESKNLESFSAYLPRSVTIEFMWMEIEILPSFVLLPRHVDLIST